MNSISKLMYTFCLWLLLIGLSCQPVKAQSDDVFSSLESLYTVTETTSYVTHSLSFENETPTVFISQFGFQIPHTNLENIRVAVDEVPIVANIVKTDKHTSIGVTFPDKLVGQGKQRTITIAYQDKEIGSFTPKSGHVIIPQPNQIESFDKYTVKINSPEGSGLPLITSQTPEQTTIGSSGAEVSYTQLKPGTLSLYYGQEQPFDFSLSYALTNENNSASIQQIPLPPDTAFQTVRFDIIDPLPESIDLDQDGNWIATYQLQNQSQQNITITGQVLLSRHKNDNFLTLLPRKQHLKSDDFWQLDNSQIKDWAKQADSIESLWSLLQPLEPYLTPNQVRSTPQDALEQSQVSAENMVDLFISAARILDIPTRRAVGLRPNDRKHPAGLADDNLHVWVEYFDANKNSWLPVDPYWQLFLGDRSFINQPYLANMVLAYNGISSTSPFPQHLESQIEFVPTTTFKPAAHNITTSIAQRFPLQLPVPGSYNLELTNQTGQALHTTPIMVSDQNGNTLFADNVALILPYQSTSIPLNLYTNTWFTSDKVTLQLALDDIHQTITVNRGPKIFQLIFSPLGLIVGVGLVIGTLATGSLLVFRR